MSAAERTGRPEPNAEPTSGPPPAGGRPPGRPLADDACEALLGGLRRFPALVVAVSGGADSVALLHLLHRWRAAPPPGPADPAPALIVATVDHGLRPESHDEARWVAALAARLGHPHHTLSWAGPRPATGIQAAARLARYRLLADLARQHPGAVIVTAHTEDDQAETVLMRLARGSGVDGLAAMREAVPVEAVLGPGPEGPDPVAATSPAPIAIACAPPPSPLVVRPLLGMAKARLVATLHALGEPWLEDPSNRAPVYERARLRRAAAALADAGLAHGPLALSARRLARASEALAALADSRWRRLVATHDGAFAELALAGLAAEPAELRVRLLARLLAAYGAGGGRAPLAKAERLEAWLHASPPAADEPQGQRVTVIAGARVAVAGTVIRVWREWGRRGLPVLALAPGQAGTWDGRFRVAIAADAAAGAWRIAALGDAGIEALRDAWPAARARLATGSARAIARTLPAAWHDGRPVSVPLLALGAPGVAATAFLHG